MKHDGQCRMHHNRRRHTLLQWLTILFGFAIAVPSIFTFLERSANSVPGAQLRPKQNVVFMQERVIEDRPAWKSIDSVSWTARKEETVSESEALQFTRQLNAIPDNIVSAPTELAILFDDDALMQRALEGLNRSTDVRKRLESHLSPAEPTGDTAL